MTNLNPSFDAAAQTATSHPPVLRMMYSSVNFTAYDKESMNHLLATSVRNNTRDDITGALMVDGLLSVQYIEGPEPAVRALWERICNDKRHHCIVQLYEKAGNLPRMFGQWAMIKGQASRAEMLTLIRDANTKSDIQPRPEWSLAIAPLMILLDPQHSAAYAQAVLK